MKIHRILITLICLVIASCASQKPEGKTEAEVLYKEAKQSIEDGRYILATEKLNQLKKKYPYSFYATPGELLEADILFKQEKFVESAAAYLLFKDFHPKHEQLPFVIYRIAESYYNQIPDTYDRDLEGAQEAIKYYADLLKFYPNTEFIKDANEKINYCKKMLRSKEQYVADFYFKTQKFSAARWRYLDILSNFNDKKLAQHSMIRVVKSSLEMKEFDKCISYADQYSSLINKDNKSELVQIKKSCEAKIR